MVVSEVLRLYRRHAKTCSSKRPEHDKAYLRCDCPLHVIGFVRRGEYVRESLYTRDFQDANRVVRDAEARGYWAAANSGSAPGAPGNLAEAIKAFLEDAINPNGRNLRPQSHATYVRLLGKLEAFCPRGCSLDAIDPDMVRRFKDGWKMGARSAAGNLSKIRAFFRYAVDNEWIDRNPAIAVRIPKQKGEDFQKHPFTPEEVDRILAAADSDPDCKACIMVMLTMGLRISDAAMLRSDHIVDGYYDHRTIKTLSRVTQPIRPELMDRLNAIAPTDGYYFAKGSRRMNTVTDLMRRRINAIFKKAGIEKGTPHRFRHSFACRMLLKGVDLKSLSLLLGHHSLTTTEKFYASFIKARERMLEDIVRKSWESDGDKAA